MSAADAGGGDQGHPGFSLFFPFSVFSDHQQRAAAVRRHRLQGLCLLLLQGEGESGDLGGARPSLPLPVLPLLAPLSFPWGPGFPFYPKLH